MESREEVERYGNMGWFVVQFIGNVSREQTRKTF